MQQTDNYNLNKFETDDELETASRLALNQNADIIDTALKDAAENGGIAVQDTQPTNDVLAWVDSDALGADFCFVGDTAPAADGTVAVWVDTSEDEIPVQSGAGGVSYDNTDSGLTADNVQGAIDEVSQNLNGIVKTMTFSGTTGDTGNFLIALPSTNTPLFCSLDQAGYMGIIFKATNYYVKVIRFNTTTYTPVTSSPVSGTVWYI